MPDAYAPRTRARLPDRRLGDVPVKLHWIDAQGAAAPPDALLGAAWATAEAVLPAAMEAEGEPGGAAFLVIHRGTLGTWLLMDWWAHGAILCQRLARAKPGSTDFAAMDDRPLQACVWEMEPIAEERAAWIAHMMRPEPDPRGWLRA